MASHHVAQLNVGHMLAPLDDPRIEGFVRQLGSVNALADAAPGFVWRLQDEAGNATSFRPFPEDDLMLVNLSVWETCDDLWSFVYRSRHLEPLKDRRLWFELPRQAHVVLWWVPAGHLPGLEEAKARLEHLRTHGPTAHAFTLKRRFPAPDAAAVAG